MPASGARLTWLSRTDIAGDSMRHAANSNTTPTTGLNQASGRLRLPPTYASGNENTANQAKRRASKQPARTYFQVPIEATTTLSISAIGFISAGASPASAMIAR
jgi:hypothetical protein